MRNSIAFDDLVVNKTYDVHFNNTGSTMRLTVVQKYTLTVPERIAMTIYTGWDISYEEARSMPPYYIEFFEVNGLYNISNVLIYDLKEKRKKKCKKN